MQIEVHDFSGFEQAILFALISRTSQHDVGVHRTAIVQNAMRRKVQNSKLPSRAFDSFLFGFSTNENTAVLGAVEPSNLRGLGFRLRERRQGGISVGARRLLDTSSGDRRIRERQQV